MFVSVLRKYYVIIHTAHFCKSTSVVRITSRSLILIYIIYIYIICLIHRIDYRTLRLQIILQFEYKIRKI